MIFHLSLYYERYIMWMQISMCASICVFECIRARVEIICYTTIENSIKFDYACVGLLLILYDIVCTIILNLLCF